MCRQPSKEGAKYSGKLLGLGVAMKPHQGRSSQVLDRTRETATLRTRAPKSKVHQSAIERFLHMAPMDQASEIRQGIEAVVLNDVSCEMLNISLRRLTNSLRLPNSTIRRKINCAARLNSAVSDRVARAMLIFASATDVLEDPSLAASWMLNPHIELRDEIPLSMLDTQAGYDSVCSILIRLADGVSV